MRFSKIATNKYTPVTMTTGRKGRFSVVTDSTTVKPDSGYPHYVQLKENTTLRCCLFACAWSHPMILGRQESSLFANACSDRDTEEEAVPASSDTQS
jgi:hypothetical protein